MQSKDGGYTWHQLTAGLPRFLHGNIEALTMNFCEDNPLEFFAGTSDGEIFASDNGGARWELIAKGLPPVSKANHHIQLPQAIGA